MIVRLVCVLASNSCIGTEPAASVTENVESENTDFRAVPVQQQQAAAASVCTVCTVCAVVVFYLRKRTGPQGRCLTFLIDPTKGT